MAHSLLRLKSTLVNTPQLIERTSFDTIMEYVDGRILGEITPQAFSFHDDDDEDTPVKVYTPSYNDEMKLGMLNIDGPITYRITGWEALCGGTSCERLKSDMEYFVEKGAKTVLLNANSGGGEAFGLFDTATYIRKLADDNGIKLITYVDGMAASACYALTCIADEYVISTDSMVGSIGVLVQLYDNSKQLEKEGIKRIFVTAGASKIPYDEDGSFKKSFLDKLQEGVDATYETFVNHVAKHRNLSVETVKSTEADTFRYEDALSIGLIDKVMTVEDFYSEYLPTYSENNLKGDNTLSIKGIFASKDKEAVEMIEALQSQLSEKETELSATLEKFTELQTSFEQVSSKLAEYEAAAQAAAEALAEMEATQAQAKLDQRKAQLADVISADKLDAQFEALSSLDDATFTAVVEQYAAMKAAQAESFQPVGGEGVEAEEETQPQETSILQQGIAAAKARWATK